MILQENFGSLQDMATQHLLAPVFLTNVATVSISNGGLFIIDNVLYRATSHISNGETISIGTGTGDNAVEASTIGQEMYSKTMINSKIDKALKFKSKLVTKSGLTSNFYIYYNNYETMVTALLYISAGTYACNVPYNNKYYISLGTISHSDVLEIWPAADTNLGLTLCTCVSEDAVSGGGAAFKDFNGFLLVRSSTSATTWTVVCGRHSQSSSGNVTISATQYYQPVGSIVKTGSNCKDFANI